MKIGVISNEHFSKTFNYRQSTGSLQRSSQPVRTPQGDYYLRSKHNYRDKETCGIMPESKNSSRCNKECKSIEPLKPLNNAKTRGLSFNGLQSAWKNKEIPLVTKGFFGDVLTAKNISAKQVGKDSFVLVGNVKSGQMTDRQVIDYFKQFISYPKCRRYILDTMKVLDNMREIR